MARQVKKRGEHTVIATVLLILLTLVIIGILVAFVLPEIRKATSDNVACQRLLNKVVIENFGYNCNYAQEETCVYRTAFSVSVRDARIEGLHVVLTGDGNSITRDITNNATLNDIRMLDKLYFGSLLETPPEQGSRSYVVRGKYDRVDIAPILANNKICTEGVVALKPIACTQEAINTIKTGCLGIDLNNDGLSPDTLDIDYACSLMQEYTIDPSAFAMLCNSVPGQYTCVDPGSCDPLTPGCDRCLWIDYDQNGIVNPNDLQAYLDLFSGSQICDACS